MSGTSAYCLIEGDGTSFQILKSYKEPKHKEPTACFEYLRDQVTQNSIKLIGIDAPLSIPSLLHDPLFLPKDRDAGGEISNPYLFRYTDYFLFQEFGLRPMPPVGDRIGRLTARAVALLQSLHLPVINERIIEVYPKQIALALGHTNPKKETQKILESLNKKDFKGDAHQVDALLAAYATMMIDHGHTIYPPEDETEGWCYVLKM